MPPPITKKPVRLTRRRPPKLKVVGGEAIERNLAPIVDSELRNSLKCVIEAWTRDEYLKLHPDDRPKRSAWLPNLDVVIALSTLATDDEYQNALDVQREAAARYDSKHGVER